MKLITWLLVALLIPFLALAGPEGPHGPMRTTARTELSATLNPNLFSSMFMQQSNSLQFDDTYGILGISDATIGITSTWTLAVWAKNEVVTPAGSDGICSVRSGAVGNSIDLNTANASNDHLRINVINSISQARQVHQWDNVIDGDTDTWHHYVATWDGTVGGLDMYIDGVDTAPTTTTSNLDDTNVTDTARSVRIGFITVTSSRWIGPIYTCALWDSVLVQAEVTAIFNGGAPLLVDLQENSGAYVSSASLIHYYRLGLGETELEFGQDEVGTLDLHSPTTSLDLTDLTTDIPN